MHELQVEDDTERLHHQHQYYPCFLGSIPRPDGASRVAVLGGGVDRRAWRRRRCVRTKVRAKNRSTIGM